LRRVVELGQRRLVAHDRAVRLDGDPSSIAVLGHSGATGENSDPQQPGVEVRANSWATGSNTYEAALKASCGAVRQCTYDGGASGNIIDERSYYSDDVNHLSIKGHAKEAAVAWAAMRRTRIVPKH
jgi:hypothetical protein